MPDIENCYISDYYYKICTIGIGVNITEKNSQSTKKIIAMFKCCTKKYGLDLQWGQNTILYLTTWIHANT